MRTNTKKWLSLPLILALTAAPFAVGDAHDTTVATMVGTEPASASAWWPTVSADLEGDERLRAIVHAITAWQIETRGESAVVLARPAHTDAASAAAALAALHGAYVPLDVAVAMTLLPADLDAAVSAVLVDFMVYEAETQRAFDGFDAQAAIGDPTYASTLRLAGIMTAQEALLASMLDLGAALDATSVRPVVPFVVPGVFLFDLGATCDDNVYTDNVPLLVDDCGNDVYENNAGGGGALGQPLGAIYPLAAALADFSGDDTYVGTSDASINGGAFGGSGFLYDEAGSDVYVTPQANDGVNGGGSVGSGFLVDAGAGSEVYAAGGWGTNGGGYIGGRGLLVEMGGSDAYSGTHDAVNGGGTAGNGALWDDGGDDAYAAWGNGVNGGGQGGSGLLYDRSGVDVYNDDVGGSGTDVTVVPKELNGAQVDDA